MGEYAVFVLSAYGVTAVAVLTLLLWTVADYRTQVRALARLEAARPGSGARAGIDVDA